MAQTEFAVSLGNVLQTVTAAGLIAGARMMWLVMQELAAIKAVIADPELGIKATIVSLRKSRHTDSNKLQEHETRLDGHDKDIERIDQVLIREPHGSRHLTATGEPYDRRSKP